MSNRHHVQVPPIPTIADEVQTAFARALGELDDIEQKLVERQARLATELGDVEVQLRRITATRRAMMDTRGQSARLTPRKPSGYTRPSATQAQQNRERVLAWARERPGEWWR